MVVSLLWLKSLLLSILYSQEPRSICPSLKQIAYLVVPFIGGFVVVYSTLSPLSQSRVVELLYL